MAFTAPTTDNDAADGFDYLHLNKIEENIRVLAGGDATLPLSTDAATGKALAKRDANGDCSFRRVVVSGMVYTAGDYVIDANEIEASSSSSSYIEVTRRIYISRSGTVRVVFRIKGWNPAYGRIYKNGVAVGTERSTTLMSTYTEYSEDIAVSAGDYLSIFVKASSGQSTIDRFRVCCGDSI